MARHSALNMETRQGHWALETVISYHELSKHHLRSYAPGPETLDWDAQPNPFREFVGSQRCFLPLLDTESALSFHSLPATEPQPFTLTSIAQLLELSLGISAWKEYGSDRWALRCNPSSGNLHPTELYLLSFAVPGLNDGLYHYLSRDHLLERRWRHHSDLHEPALYLALTSIAWREAWKYGVRALRYCQLDIGHALGALAYAAATLGWQLRPRLDVDGQRLHSLLGLDRSVDFAGAENEDEELLLEIVPAKQACSPLTFPALDSGEWHGRANCLDPQHLYEWPIVGETSIASRMPTLQGGELPTDPWPPRHKNGDMAASALIRGRRSAQRFDAKTFMAADVFFSLVDALLPRSDLPWDFWPFAPRIHPIFMVHRVEGLQSGLYAFPRSSAAEDLLRGCLSSQFSWQPLDNAPKHLPLRLLHAGDLRRLARTLCCHQAIAADSCFSVIFLAEYTAALENGAWHYRLLYQEAGLLGQVLYLEAESLGFNGTGIGCFFDDAVHEILGIKDHSLQSLYHFTVGRALSDTRISTTPAYAHRSTHKEIGEHP